MQLITARLLLRPYQEADFPDLFRLQCDPEIMRYIRPVETEEAPVRERIAQWLQYGSDNPGYLVFMIEHLDNQEFVGYGVFRHHDFTPGNDIEIGYSLSKEFWGQGYATEVVRRLLAYAHATLKLPKVVAFTDPENHLSNRVLERCGFVCVCKEQLETGERLGWEFQFG